MMRWLITTGLQHHQGRLSKALRIDEGILI